MRGITHAAVGVSLGFMVSQHFDVNPLLSVVTCTVGALVTDIDEKHSMINKVIPGGPRVKNVVKIVLGILLFTQMFFELLLYPFQFYFLLKLTGLQSFILFLKGMLLFKVIGLILILSAVCSKIEYRFTLFGGLKKRVYHRTIFHDPLIGGMMLTLPLLLFIKDAGVAVLVSYDVGVFSHYILDSFTEYGLPFYLTGGRIRMPIYFRSGNKIVEFIVLVICIGYVTTYKNTIITQLISFIL